MNPDFIEEHTTLESVPVGETTIVEFDENGNVTDDTDDDNSFVESANDERARVIEAASHDADFVAGLGLKNGDSPSDIEARISQALFGV